MEGGQRFKVSIKVISDVICPWCYIGKKRLEQALARHSDRFEFEVKWLPFILHPELPRTGVAAPKGLLSGDDAAVRAAAQTVGIPFAAQSGTIGNTVDVHRLLAYADRQGRQSALLEGLFTAHFERGENVVGSPDVLARVASEAGLDADQVRTYLASEEDLEWVITIDLHWKEQQAADGLPFFVFNDRIAFSGSQSPEVFGQVFDALQKQQTAASSSSTP